MPTGWHYEGCDARLVKWEYRKCESTFDSNSSIDLKLNERDSFPESLRFFLYHIIFFV